MAFDRRDGDVGNIVEFGHVNLRVPDQRLATAFYVSGLGLTRDPYVMTGINNMWVNAGRTQFHLPTGRAQVVRGTIELVLPDLAALRARLSAVAAVLAETEFAVLDQGDALLVTCPWGNRLRCVAAEDPRLPLGISAVSFDVPVGTLPGIARFYRQLLHAEVLEGEVLQVCAGPDAVLVFAEAELGELPYDGHHVQITVADFSGPHRRLRERGLISREDDPFQYRFMDILDPDGGPVLFSIEHEVRSVRHPMFGRPLINRNPAQTNIDYVPGRDAFHG
jgi:catechol 2,3-dioxygenase-like lactoylglutathione lyase family enzyme